LPEATIAPALRQVRQLSWVQLTSN